MIGPYGRYGRQQLVEFRRVHNQVQLLARNTEFVAGAGTPEGRAVQAAFSPSLLASAPVASQPHPERKAVLVEANALFVTDLLGIGMALQRTYRQGYAFDAPQLGHHHGARQARAGGARGHGALRDRGASPCRSPARRRARRCRRCRARCPTRAACSSACTTRSPRCRQQPMRAAQGRPAHRLLRHRVAATSATTWRARRASASSTAGGSRRRIRRRRCPSRSSRSPSGSTAPIPLKYRDAITAGVLEWNKAFEKIGFKNAVRVEDAARRRRLRHARRRRARRSAG